MLQLNENWKWLDAFILTWRFFLLQRELSSFPSLVAAYEKLPIPAEYKRRLADARSRFNNLRQEKVQIAVDEEVLLTNEQLEDILLNGGRAHASNKDLREKFKLLVSFESAEALAVMELSRYLRGAMSILSDVQYLNQEVIQILAKEQAA